MKPVLSSTSRSFLYRHVFHFHDEVLGFMSMQFNPAAVTKTSVEYLARSVLDLTIVWLHLYDLIIEEGSIT